MARIKHIFLVLSNSMVPEKSPNPQKKDMRPAGGGGGGGGTQIWFRRGCAAEAAKPVPIFKGYFGGIGYPLLGVWRKRVPIIRGFYSRK